MSARVLLATCRELSSGEPGHEALDEALLARGIDASWAVWDDIDVDWSAADLVAARSTLLALTEADVRASLGRGAAGVVKPTVGANGVGVAAVEDNGWVPETAGPWLVQPFVESISTEGEISAFVIDGQVVAQVVKTPAVGEFLVHEERGGTAHASSLTDEVRSIAHQAYAATERLLDFRLTYARVDLLRHQGTLVVTEVEITEPGLYLDVMPEIAQPFADAVARLLAA